MTHMYRRSPKISKVIKQASFASLLTAMSLLASCHKTKEAPPPVSPVANLTDGPWGLISSTKDTLGSLTTEKGASGDSLFFEWQYNANSNVVPTNITSFIGGNVTQYGYTFYQTNTYVPSTAANLMMICSQQWEPGYSDTLTIINLSDKLLIFQVNAVGSNAYIIDSLDKLRFY